MEDLKGSKLVRWDTTGVLGIWTVEGQLASGVGRERAPGGVRVELYKIADIHSFWSTKMSVSMVQPKEGIWKLRLFWNFASDYPRLCLHPHSTQSLFYPNTLMKAQNEFRQIFIFNLLTLPVDIKLLYASHYVQTAFFFFNLHFQSAVRCLWAI